MRHLFRKSHRFLAPIIALPLVLTVLTGMAATVAEEWPLKIGLSSRLLLKVHTGEIFGLQAVYPILNGLGLLGLLVTGLSMSGLLKKRRMQQSND